MKKPIWFVLPLLVVITLAVILPLFFRTKSGNAPTGSDFTNKSKAKASVSDGFATAVVGSDARRCRIPIGGAEKFLRVKASRP